MRAGSSPAGEADVNLDAKVVCATRGELEVRPGQPTLVCNGLGEIVGRFYNPDDADLFVWMHQRRTAIAAMQEFIERVHVGPDENRVPVQ